MILNAYTAVVVALLIGYGLAVGAGFLLGLLYADRRTPATPNKDSDDTYSMHRHY